MTLEPHPLADLFPLLEGVAFDDLVVDIKANGLAEPIVTYQGKILDGRNRYRALERLGFADQVRCHTDEFTGPDPLAFVISKNVKRRHLDESQRAMIAARLANVTHGGDRRSDQAASLPLVSQEQAAATLGVSERSVRSAVVVRDCGTPELIRAVEQRDIAVSFAAQALAPLDPLDQKRWLARAAEEQWSPNDLRFAMAQEKAICRTRHVAFDAIALGKFGIIYADPPWRYENPPMGGPSRRIENHYPTMTIEEICALPVADVAHEDCILFMWTTPPKMAESCKVIEAWGFNYRTCMCWVKDKIGMGWYVRQRHELLLIARRGEPPHPATANRPDSVIEAPRLEHSAKPPVVREIIARMYPDLPRIDLFAREAAPGWKCWGNQVSEAGR